MAPRVTPRPGAAPQPTARDHLLHTWPGRLFLIAAALKLVIAVWRIAGTVPAAVIVIHHVSTLALAIAVGVSTKSIFVLGRIAASINAGRDVST